MPTDENPRDVQDYLLRDAERKLANQLEAVEHVDEKAGTLVRFLTGGSGVVALVLAAAPAVGLTVPAQGGAVGATAGGSQSAPGLAYYQTFLREPAVSLGLALAAVSLVAAISSRSLSSYYVGLPPRAFSDHVGDEGRSPDSRDWKRDVLRDLETSVERNRATLESKATRYMLSLYCLEGAVILASLGVVNVVLDTSPFTSAASTVAAVVAMLAVVAFDWVSSDQTEDEAASSVLRAG